MKNINTSNNVRGGGPKNMYYLSNGQQFERTMLSETDSLFVPFSF